MFHMKHNSKDNITHVHIGARTGAQVHGQAALAGDRTGAPPDEPTGRADMTYRLDMSYQPDMTYKTYHLDNTYQLDMTYKHISHI